MKFTRRALVASATLAGAAPVLLGSAAGQSAQPPMPRFGYDHVVARARGLAAAPFDPAPPLPSSLANLAESRWRNIRFRSDHAFFADNKAPFRMELFHLGGPYRESVTVNIVKDGIAAPIPYAPNLFDYGGADFSPPLPINLGFAGLRLRFPLNDSHVYDEVIAFLGASYFRFLGQGQRYGLSARGVAVNAGQPDEEFPFFREFWVEAPKHDARTIVIYALLDGPSLTGAYRFMLTPSRDSLLDVTATLFARQAGRKIGVAPLSSMFCAGENDRRIHNSYHPERHNSDGLCLHTGDGEWIWRPLRNPATAQTSAFLDRNVGGFGLLQRDRIFTHYQDVEREYQLFPSYWIEPQEKWGAGRIELVELPTDDAQSDNIVASFVSSAPLEPGQAKAFRYAITASLGHPDPSPNGRVQNTFLTQARSDGSAAPAPNGAQRFLVDFAGGDLAYYQNAPKLVTAVPTAVNGTVISSFLEPNPYTQGFRAGIDVSAASGQICELRLFLRAGGRVLTETWTLPWRPA